MTFPQSNRIVAEERGTAREGCRGALAVTAQRHMHNFKELVSQPVSPASQPARRPPEHAGRAGWGHVSSEGVCVQYVHGRQQVLSPFERVCAFPCTRHLRAEGRGL